MPWCRKAARSIKSLARTVPVAPSRIEDDQLEMRESDNRKFRTECLVLTHPDTPDYLGVSVHTITKDQAPAEVGSPVLPGGLFPADDELFPLTGYKRARNQIQWLRQQLRGKSTNAGGIHPSTPERVCSRCSKDHHREP